MGSTWDCYVLEIYKNTGIHHNGNPIITDASCVFHDELRYKKLCGNQKGYLNYFNFRINDTYFENVQKNTLSQTLSLYRHGKDYKEEAPTTDEEDPFVDREDAPFLILIQVCLCRKAYLYIKDSKKNETSSDVETFLQTAENMIEKKVKSVFTPEESKNLIWKIFRSSTTGDFCLVIRTACEDLITKTVDHLQSCAIWADIAMTVWRKKSQTEEGVYVNIPPKTKSVNRESDVPEAAKKKRERNQDLFKDICKLRCYEKYFAQENRIFQDLLYATKKLYGNYAASAHEKDTEINWQIWYHDMENLCESINNYMGTYQKIDSVPEDRRRKFRLNLLQNWRENILAIDCYSRLIHNVNGRNCRGSVFDAQTQVNAEKLLVAYREAMWVYYRGYDEISAAGDQAKIKIEPIIYSSLVKEKIEVTTLFANMMDDLYGTHLDRKKVCVCSVPSFENFGRLYDFLPLLMHETAHSIRALERAERNDFLIHYTLKHVFGEVIRHLLQELPNVNRYEDMGAATGNLLKAFLKTAESDVKSNLESYAKPYGASGEDFSFEQTADALSRYLQELFPQETNVTKDFEKARDRLLDLFVMEFRQNGMLEDSNAEDCRKLLNDLQALKNSRFVDKNSEEILEIALTAKNEKVKALFPGKSDSSGALFEVKDFIMPAKEFDKKVRRIRKKLEDEKTAHLLNEYIFSATKLHRIYRIYNAADKEYRSPEEKREKLLYQVFANYREMERSESNDFPSDPETMYFLNYMGLLGEDKKVFFKQCSKAFDTLPFQTIYDCKRFRTGVYRETCADVMMAVSLKLTAFGYCRQIFHAISDTAQQYSYDKYESLNFVRFRTVAALLLLNEEWSVMKEEYGEDEYRINGENLIKEGMRYCEHYLKYIRESIFDKEKIKDAGLREKIYALLGTVNEQIKILLNEYSESFYKQTLLYILIHGEVNDLPGEIRNYLETNQELIDICRKYRQHFGELECFCRGLQHILFEGNIIVERDFLDHMLKLRERVALPASSYRHIPCGCKWEETLWPCMREIKEKVGNYYNDPESIFTVSEAEKLDDTIAFIQNYYYHNRYDIAGKGVFVNGESTEGSSS